MLQLGGSSQRSSSGMVLNLDVDSAIFDKTPWWPEPLRVTAASGQVKLNYDPLTLDLGLLQAEVNGTNLSLSGQAALTPLGWSYDGAGAGAFGRHRNRHDPVAGDVKYQKAGAGLGETCATEHSKI